MLEIRTEVPEHIQEQHFQNGTLVTTKHGFAVTIQVDLTSDATLNDSRSQEEIIERARALFVGTGVDIVLITSNNLGAQNTERHC